MLLLDNTKTKNYLNITITKNTKSKDLIISKETVIELKTLDITKLYKIKIVKEFDLKKDEYFKFINYLAESINDYRNYLKN